MINEIGHHMTQLNLGNAIFEGCNDKEGIMICGYEWGNSKSDQEQSEELETDFSIPCTFSNKALRYGEKAKKWTYDNNIKKWFTLWGHALDESGLGSEFDKSLVQTNWAITCNSTVTDYSPFLEPQAIDNFLFHVEKLKPKIIIFIGRQLIDFLRTDKVLGRFTKIMGTEISPLKKVQKTEYQDRGTKFNIFFNDFENCKVICFPHTFGSRGLSDKYIALYKKEMNQILSEFKKEKGIAQ